MGMTDCSKKWRGTAEEMAVTAEGMAVTAEKMTVTAGKEKGYVIY